MSEQLDPWKRDVHNQEERYPEQLQLQLNKTVEATEEAVSYTHLTLPTICSV